MQHATSISIEEQEFKMAQYATARPVEGEERM